MNLLQKLDIAYSRDTDPDKVVSNLRPFSKWRRCKSITYEEFDANPGLHIVLCHDSYGNNTAEATERYHVLGPMSQTDDGLQLYGWGRDSLVHTLGSFFFRSYESFMENPDEGF